MRGRQGISLAVSCVMLAAAAVMAFAKKIHVREDGGVDADMYIPGKKEHPGMVFITNSTPAKISVSAVKNYINGKFSN